MQVRHEGFKAENGIHSLKRESRSRLVLMELESLWFFQWGNTDPIRAVTSAEDENQE